MTLAVMGYHFQVMTRELSKAMDKATKAAKAADVPAEKARSD
jgi:ribosomal protein L13E